MNEFKDGVESDDGKAKPALQEFKEQADLKLRELNILDREVSDAAVREVFGDRPQKEITIFPSKKRFSKIIMSMSNSAAKDAHGMSLKVTKVLLGFSKAMFNIYYDLTKAMARSGYVPKCWTVDTISFLYKRKGERERLPKTGGQLPSPPVLASTLKKCY